MKHTVKLGAVALAVHLALVPTVVFADAAPVAEPVKAKDSESKRKEKSKKRDETIEVIQIVSSYTDSITEANLQKQSAVGVSDVIVADDIAKFPDNNLAEALQRMTGISIQRNQGEGRYITIRGLGGDYNVTTINGRLMANEEGSRQFSYDTIAAELIGGVQVFKSPEARLSEGGIGGVVDVRTRKPLQLDKFTANLSASGSYDRRTETADPTVSMLIGDKTADENFGYILSAVHSKRTLRNDGYSAFSFYEPDSYTNYLKLPYDVNQDGVIDRNNYAELQNEGLESTVAPGFQYSVYQDVRERSGLQGAIQWQPTEQLSVDVDLIANQYQTDGRSHSMFMQYYDNYWMPLETRPVASQVERLADGRASSFTLTGQPSYLVAYDLSPRDVSNWLIGNHARWLINDEWQLDGDLSHSRALGRNKGDTGTVLMRGFADEISMARQPGQQLPDVSVTEPAGGSRYYFDYADRSGTNIDAITDQLQLSAKYQGADLLNELEFGYHWTTQQKNRQKFGVPTQHLSTFSYGGAALGDLQRQADVINGYQLFSIPDEYLLPADFSPLFGGQGRTPQPWAGFDLARLQEFYQGISVDGASRMQAQLDQKNSYKVQEELHAFYLQANLDFADWRWPTQLNLGLRATQTRTTVDGFSQDYRGIRFDASRKPVAGSYDPEAIHAIEVKNDFWNVLPSLNLKTEFSDTLVGRFASAKVIGRPNIDYLAPYNSINFAPYNTPGGIPLLDAGNPLLEPEEAIQHDLSLEWYFAEASSLTGALYYKNLQSLVEQVEMLAEPGLLGIPLPMVVKSHFLSDYGATIKGMELAYQQSLTDFVPDWAAGLGFQTNYTLTKTAYEDPEKAGKPFRGVPKETMNVVVYLDKPLYSVRVSYNKSASTLLDHNRWIGGYPFMQGYQQFDFSSSLNLPANISLTFNVANLTNEVNYGYLDNPDRVNSYFQFGRVYSLGLSTRF